MIKIKIPLSVRFFAKVIKGQSEDDCWGWSGATEVDGYGVIKSDIRTADRAHRVSWRLHFGHVPDGMWVLHKCDNPPCSNPKHLFLGTCQDNEDDKKRKKRHMFGERSHSAKLTSGGVLTMRALSAAGMRDGILKKIFNVKNSRQIIIGISWGHLPNVWPRIARPQKFFHWESPEPAGKK